MIRGVLAVVFDDARIEKIDDHRQHGGVRLLFSCANERERRRGANALIIMLRWMSSMEISLSGSVSKIEALLISTSIGPAISHAF